MRNSGNGAEGTHLKKMNGSTLHDHISALFPLARSITGPGVRQSLEYLREIVPLDIHAVPTGQAVLDWEVPKEWYFIDGFIADADGKRLVDASVCNLHVVNFSVPVDRRVTRAELEPHLHSLPDQPTAVPYRTSYYNETWGFCLSDQARAALGDGPFHVRIDARLEAGELNWGELVVPGESATEILVSTHICHPSLANDNLSGMVLAAALAASRLQQRNPHTWRFVFVPGTIGAISWLDRHRDDMPDIRAGLVLTGLGDSSDFTWKLSRDGDAWIDRIAQHVLRQQVPDHHAVIPFGPYGYDERQYASPGFSLPVGRLTRAVHGTFPQYHTDGDDLSFVEPARLSESLALLESIAELIDRDVTYENQCPYGEPQLGKRGLYASLGARANPGELQMAMLWMLNQSDGNHSLLDIAERSNLPSELLHEAATLLKDQDLLRVSAR